MIYLIHNQDFMAVIAFLSAVITFVTIIPTAVSLQSSRRSNRQMEGIIDSLTTKFEGDFPHYLPKIAEIIPRAKSRLLILGVIPTHGAYTKTEAWLKIQDALEDKMKQQERLRRSSEAEAFTATLVYGQRWVREKNYDAVFLRFAENESEWQTWKKDSDNRKQLTAFLKLATKGEKQAIPNIDSLTISELRHIRLTHDERAVSNVYEHFERRAGDEIFPFFCWITDDEAVFSFKTEDPQGHYNGSGIYTRDPKLIETLAKTFESFRIRASQVSEF